MHWESTDSCIIWNTPSLTTEFFLWKTKGLKATGFWNVFSRYAIYGGAQNQPTIYLAGKLLELSTRGIFLICLRTRYFSGNVAAAVCLCFSALRLFIFCFLFTLILWGGLIIFFFFALMVGSFYHLILRLPLPFSVGMLCCLLCGSSPVNPL